jgi:hypothetical protein
MKKNILIIVIFIACLGILFFENQKTKIDNTISDDEAIQYFYHIFKK